MERQARSLPLALAACMAVCLVVPLALVGCAAASSSAQTSTPPPGAATATTTTSAPAATSAPGGGSATATITPLPGSANLAGAADICATPISVGTTLPAEIPAFNGQLRLAQANAGISEFGYCSGASVASIAAFFTAQLPSKGWQHIQTFDNNATRNIIATRGAENLTITILPDAVQLNNTDLLIILTGQG